VSTASEPAPEPPPTAQPAPPAEPPVPAKIVFDDIEFCRLQAGQDFEAAFEEAVAFYNARGKSYLFAALMVWDQSVGDYRRVSRRFGQNAEKK
jgi:hypothetical protein